MFADEVKVCGQRVCSVGKAQHGVQPDEGGQRIDISPTNAGMASVL